MSGSTLAEKISKLTVEDIKQAADTLSTPRQNSLSRPRLNSNSKQNVSVASSFLKSVTSTCKVLGHTTEAAKEARKKLYATSECFGTHSIFLTFNPDDECPFRVKIYANNGNVMEVPGLNCSENRCIADFNMRHTTRTKYPGACSLNYQAAMQAVCTLLGWDFEEKTKEDRDFW